MNDIKQTLNNQDKNLFEDLIGVAKDVKQEMTVENFVRNKFNIDDWAPKAIEEETKSTKKKRQILLEKSQDDGDDSDKSDKTEKIKDDKKESFDQNNTSNI